MLSARMVKNIILSLFGLGVIWLCAVILPHWIAHSHDELFSLGMGSLRFTGWIPIGLGTWAILWSYGMFVLVGDGTPWPFDPPRELVNTGPYRFVRNPMECGFVLVVFGETLLLESAAILLYLVTAFMVLYVRQVAVDEPMLRSRFGAAYEDYCKSVPRWIPRLDIRS